MISTASHKLLETGCSIALKENLEYLQYNFIPTNLGGRSCLSVHSYWKKAWKWS